MMPSLVRFSGGIEIEPRLVINRRYDGPTPSHWMRHQFFVESLFSDPEWQLNEWLANNIVGRWTITSEIMADGSIVVLGVEDATDAVMFRLLDGDTAWRVDTVKIL